MTATAEGDAAEVPVIAARETGNNIYFVDTT